MKKITLNKNSRVLFIGDSITDVKFNNLTKPVINYFKSFIEGRFCIGKNCTVIDNAEMIVLILTYPLPFCYNKQNLFNGEILKCHITFPKAMSLILT